MEESELNPRRAFAFPLCFCKQLGFSGHVFWYQVSYHPPLRTFSPFLPPKQKNHVIYYHTRHIYIYYIYKRGRGPHRVTQALARFGFLDCDLITISYGQENRAGVSFFFTCYFSVIAFGESPDVSFFVPRFLCLGRRAICLFVRSRSSATPVLPPTRLAQWRCKTSSGCFLRLKILSFPDDGREGQWPFVRRSFGNVAREYLWKVQKEVSSATSPSSDCQKKCREA